MAKKTKASKTNRLGKLLKDLTYSTTLVSTEIGGVVPIALIGITASDRRKMGCVPGAVFSLKIGEDELLGMVSETQEPPQLAGDEFQKRRRKEKNFGIAEIKGKFLEFHVDKRSRSAPFRFPEDDTVKAKLRIIDKSSVPTTKKAVREVALKSGGKAITPTPGSMEKAIPKLTEAILESNRGWSLFATYEKDGKAWKVHVHIDPPRPKLKIGALVEAIYGEPSSDTMTCLEQKQFRGWPGSVERAFTWVAKKAKGGVYLERKTEVRGPSQKPTKKQLALANAAFTEAFGLCE